MHLIFGIALDIDGESRVLERTVMDFTLKEFYGFRGLQLGFAFFWIHDCNVGQ